ncbi:MAG: HD domain-containing protein [Anaerolineae bacterium]
MNVTALLRPIDWEQAAEVLSPALLALFERMPRTDQLHSLRVMQRLREAGHTHPDLLTAALLHDVGKTRHPFRLPGRIFVVLVRTLLPERYTVWSQSEPAGWQRPLAVSAQHPAWSAELMAAAGASALAVGLARRHADPPVQIAQTEADRLLIALQHADDAS